MTENTPAVVPQMETLNKQIEADNKAQAKNETDATMEMNAQKIMLERINLKKIELLEIQQQIEKRNKEFAEMLKETELSGRAFGGGAAGNAEEEKKRRDAMKLIEGTGLERMVQL